MLRTIIAFLYLGKGNIYLTYIPDKNFYISGQNEEILIFTKIMTPHFLRKMKYILTHIDTVDVMPCALQASNVGRIPELLGPRV